MCIVQSTRICLITSLNLIQINMCIINRIFILISLFIVLHLVHSDSGFPLDDEGLPFTDCGSIHFISNLQVQNCTEFPCNLCIGQSVSVSFDLSAAQENSILNNDVAVSIRGLKFGLEATPDPCDAMICPITNSYSTTYKADVAISDLLFQTSADFIWVLLDNANNQMACFQIPVVLHYSTTEVCGGSS